MRESQHINKIEPHPFPDNPEKLFMSFCLFVPRLLEHRNAGSPNVVLRDMWLSGKMATRTGQTRCSTNRKAEPEAPEQEPPPEPSGECSRVRCSFPPPSVRNEEPLFSRFSLRFSRFLVDFESNLGHDKTKVAERTCKSRALRSQGPLVSAPKSALKGALAAVL